MSYPRYRDEGGFPKSTSRYRVEVGIIKEIPFRLEGAEGRFRVEILHVIGSKWLALWNPIWGSQWLPRYFPFSDRSGDNQGNPISG
jgi:hypothetical protein